MKLCLSCYQSFASSGWECPFCAHHLFRQDGFVLAAPSLCHSTNNFKPEYFANLYELEANSFWFRARNKIVLWSLRKYLQKAGTFLEIGCGTGFVLSALAVAYPNVDLLGTEILLDGLPHAFRRTPSASFMQMDARHIPFVSHFDGIGAFDVLEHIEEDESVLAQMSQALHPGGFIILTVPQHPWLWSPADDYACHKRRYSRAELMEKVRRAGFEIQRCSSFVSLLLPLMILCRIGSRGKAYNPNNEFDIHPALNIMLYLIMKAEILMLRCGIQFSAGGSLLLIARKP